MAYSAMPPSAVLVMATTRLPSHGSAPSPAASTTPQTSMPSVKGGGVGTDTSFPRHRSMSLKFSDAAADLDPYLARARFGSLDGRAPPGPLPADRARSPARPLIAAPR